MAKKETEEEFKERVAVAIRTWSSKGEVMNARDLTRQIALGPEHVDVTLLNTGRVRPKPGVDLEEVGGPPPREGRGSGIKAWKAFAHATSDMDAEVIDSMEKEELIAALISTGVIPAEEEESE